ncbi:unnamed protein product, partial [Polarella glacialis]
DLQSPLPPPLPDRLPPLPDRDSPAASPAKSTDASFGFEEEQLMELARIAEELTDALEASRSSEAEAFSQLAAASSRLEQAEQREAGLHEALAQQQDARKAERARLTEMELRNARFEIERHLELALKNKGRSMVFRHVDV